jgi:hypothetical protein
MSLIKKHKGSTDFLDAQKRYKQSKLHHEYRKSKDKEYDTIPCPTCNQTGKWQGGVCPDCNGSGRYEPSEGDDLNKETLIEIIKRLEKKVDMLIAKDAEVHKQIPK